MKRSAPDNETNCDKAVGKQLIASEHCMCRGTMDSSNYDCEYLRDGYCWGNQSVLKATNCKNGFSGLAGE